MRVTVLAEPPSNPERITRAVREHAHAGVQVHVATDPARLPLHARAPEDLDLIHVPSGGNLDLAGAKRLATMPGEGRIGVLSEDAGLVLTDVDRESFARFVGRTPAQADEGVYREGADIRAGAKAQAIPLPRQVYLGLTQRCNRSCSFCVSRTFAEDMLTVDEVRAIAEELVGSVDVLALTGAGEAMVHPDFWSILDMLVETLPDVVFKMNTSGIALRHNAERLLEYPVKNITVSLNAGTKETYEKVVGRGFAAALRGIETLVEERARLGRDDLRLCLSIVLMVSTMAEIEDVVRIAFELGVEEVQGIYLMVNDDDLAAESPWHEPERSNECLDRAAALGRTLGVEVSLPPRFGERTNARDSSQRTSLPKQQGQRCVEPWSTAYVRPDGEVIPCPYFEESMGSVRDLSLAEVWHGAGFERLREGILSGDPCEECRTCCGFNEGGSVDDYNSHWLGARRPERVGK